MKEYAAVLIIAIPVFLLLIIIEWLIGKNSGKSTYRSFDVISSLSSGVTNALKDILNLTVVIISYEWLYNHLAIIHIQSSVMLYILTFIALDFAGYWSHRFEHKINIFWNRHIIHHSSEEFNLACALRQSISAIFNVFFFLMIPAAILGLPPKIVSIVAPLHLFAQFWYHTTLIGKMSFLEKIIVTPSHHRVHHAINDIYIDKNFSQIFILWDKWFGTFQAELAEEPPVYGVKKPVKTWNPILINFKHVWSMIVDAYRARSYFDKARIWFMPTGWRPKDVEDHYKIDIIEDPQSYQKFDTPAPKTLITWTWFCMLATFTLLFHFLFCIGKDYSFGLLFFYACFITLHVYAYTSLMDRSIQCIYTEVIKLIFLFIFMFMNESWFGISILVLVVFNLMTLMMSIYFLQRTDKHLELASYG